MEKQRVFIPMENKERIREIRDACADYDRACYLNELSDDSAGEHFSNGIIFGVEKVKSLMKEKEGYFFTSDEIEKLISDNGFNVEDQAGVKYYVLDIDELKEKLKI